MNTTIEKAEAELNRIWQLREEMMSYQDSDLKTALLLSCELCEEIWKRELCRLRLDHLKGTKPFKKEAPELLTREELEAMAFDICTPEAIAGEALRQLIDNRCLN